MRGLERPTTIRGIRSLVGFFSYLRRTIFGYSEIVKPLIDLLVKGAKFRWGSEQEQAFIQLKQAVTTEPVLTFPDFNKKFLLFCDASCSCLGTMLSQEVNGNIRPLGYYSRRLNKTEQLWVISDLELLSIVMDLKHVLSVRQKGQPS